MKESVGRLHGMLPGGVALVAAPMPDGVDDEVRVLWPDREEITPEQRRKIFALNGEIATWSGDDPESVRKTLISDFLMKKRQDLMMETLSLASGGGCDKGTASLLIDFLINLVLEYGIPTKQPLGEYADDLSRYTYAALIHKRCLVCGRKADIHHCEGSMVGMGRNRKEMIHVGLELMPLCRAHHDECHRIGQMVFDEKYHVKGAIADEKICKRLGLKYAE